MFKSDIFNKPGTEESAETLNTSEAPEPVDTTGKCVLAWFPFCQSAPFKS